MEKDRSTVNGMCPTGTGESGYEQQDVVGTRSRYERQDVGTRSRYEGEDVGTRCGYGSCRPDWLQTCNNPRAILVFFCWFAFLQGFVVNGVNNVNTTSVERRFKLSSYQAGLISSAYDFSAGIFVLPLTYFGAHAHQPRLLALAAFIMALGSFTMSLPHFTTSQYYLGDSSADSCDLTGNSTVCKSEDSGLSNYLGVLMFGQFLHGIGGATLYSLGIVFLDSNVKAKNSPVYQGILLAFSTLGPAIGYLLGGMFLNIYVDFDVVSSDQVSITPEDPRWVGAWWLGFLSAGILSLTIVPALAPYPRELPTAAAARADRVCQVHKGENEAVNREDFGQSISDLPTSCRLLATNSAFLCVSMGTVSELLLAAGFATFLPKFIQNQFTQTVSWSALLAGFLSVPGAAGGNFVGGLVMRFLKLKVRGMIRVAILSATLCIGLTPMFLAQCPTATFAGVSVPYHNRSGVVEMGEVNLTDQCNAQCLCTEDSYEPICGSNGVQYFSPCHAGCLNSTSNPDGSKSYFQCGCIDTVHSNSTTGTPDASSGPCTQDCWQMNLFLPLFFLIIFFTFSAAVPAISVTLRCVAEKQRAFAVGIQWVLVRFLGTVPGPVLFGFVFDRACVLWQSGCDGKGSCWIYDNDKLSLNMLLLALCLKVVSLAFFCLTYLFYKPPTHPSLTKSTDTLGVNSISSHMGAVYDNPLGVTDMDTKRSRSTATL